MSHYFTETEIENLGRACRAHVNAGGTSKAWLRSMRIVGEKAQAVLETVVRRAIAQYRRGVVPMMWRPPYANPSTK